MPNEDFFTCNGLQKEAILTKDVKELNKFPGAKKLVDASKKPWFNPEKRSPIEISNDYNSILIFKKDYRYKLNAVRREIIKKHACDKDGGSGLDDELKENGLSTKLSDSENKLLEELSKDCERAERERKIQEPERN